MKQQLLLILLFSLTGNLLQAQGFAWGVKGGLTLGTQKWENIEQDPLFKYHAAAYIESLSEENRFGVFAQVGYHVKGSALRNNRVFLTSGETYKPPTQEFQFRNISVVLGAKQKFDFQVDKKWYYALGIRGDYTVSTNLDDYKNDVLSSFSGYFPDNFFVNDFTYGGYLAGGMEWMLSDFVGGIIELSISPDFSFQYKQPPLTVTNPYNPTGADINLGERKITNIVFEVTVGFRFIRAVEYID